MGKYLLNILKSSWLLKKIYNFILFLYIFFQSNKNIPKINIFNHQVFFITKFALKIWYSIKIFDINFNVFLILQYKIFSWSNLGLFWLIIIAILYFYKNCLAKLIKINLIIKKKPPISIENNILWFYTNSINSFNSFYFMSNRSMSFIIS